MEIKNSKRWAATGWEPYYMALLGYILAFAIRHYLTPLLDDHLPMLLFALNCAVIAFLYGFWPSFLTLLISVPTALYFFVKPYGEFTPVSESDLFLMIVYFTLITVFAVMIELLHRSQYRAELLAKVADSRYRLLIEADEDRRTHYSPPTT
jgi:K+-sensing histidine kinase KdpD